MGLKPIRSETFSAKAMRSVAGGTGRDWAISISKMASGTESAFCPAGYTKFVSTPAPAWVADKRPIYGAFFWINGCWPISGAAEAYYMAGAGGQTTMIIPVARSRRRASRPLQG